MDNFKNFLEIVEKRRSIRSYRNIKVEKEKIDYVLEAFRKAPSAKNLQPWKLVIVIDKETMKNLAAACRNQTFICEAPIAIVACAKEEEAYGTMGGYLNSYPVDIGISLEHLVLAATEQGLGTCWIGAFDEKAVKKVIGVPENVRVVAVTPLGYPDEQGRERSRKPIEEIVSYNTY
ncbi:MAG: nitroreductase family protein [Actinomycetota bacterium]|nr:nitroreductase family protein [Actinomycetota bacterium]